MSLRPCPLCQSEGTGRHLTTSDTTFGFPGEFFVVKCRTCGMLFTNPQLSESDIGLFYPADYSAHAPDRAALQKKRSGNDPWDKLPVIGRKRLLDIGCGSGAYLVRQRNAGWTVLGVEPSEAAAQAARRHGLSVVSGTLDQLEAEPGSFDVITIMGVLDHVPLPLPLLQRACKLLSSQGQLIVTVPNAGSAAAEIFGDLWPGWDLPRHQNHFTPSTLSRMLSAAGFENTRLTGKRRTSRWRRAAGLKAERESSAYWRFLAQHRRLCSALSMVHSRGMRADELVAVATKPQ